MGKNIIIFPNDKSVMQLQRHRRTILRPCIIVLRCRGGTIARRRGPTFATVDSSANKRGPTVEPRVAARRVAGQRLAHQVNRRMLRWWGTALLCVATELGNSNKRQPTSRTLRTELIRSDGPGRTLTSAPGMRSKVGGRGSAFPPLVAHSSSSSS